MKQLKSILAFALFTVMLFSVGYSQTGSFVAKNVELHAQGNLALIRTATVDFKVVTFAGKTYAWTKLTGSTMDGDGTWQSQLRFWTGTNGAVENQLRNWSNDKIETWGYTEVSASGIDSISIFLNILEGGFSETPHFAYNAAIPNSPVPSDVTAPVLSTYNYSNLTQISATLEFAATDDNDVFYIVKNNTTNAEQIVFFEELALSELTPLTPYSYDITPVDFSGNIGTPQTITFTTPGATFLATPTGISITDSTITYTGDAAALTHNVKVYRGATALLEISQNINSETGGILHCQNLPTGEYTVTVQAMGNEMDIMSSGVSASYTWEFTNDDYEAPSAGTSLICKQEFETRGVLFSVETEGGKLIVTIAPKAEGATATFRAEAEGLLAKYFTINGHAAPEGTPWFTKEGPTEGSLTQTFVPDGIELRAGDVIDYNGLNTWSLNGAGDYTFNFKFSVIGAPEGYIWGSRCQRLTAPANVAIDGDRRITFEDSENASENVEGYLATIKNSAGVAAASMTVVSGDILEYDVAGGTVTVQAVSNNPDIASSDPSTPFEWTYTNTGRITYPSAFWNMLVDPQTDAANACAADNRDAANWTFETINGKLIITISAGPSGVGEFRNDNRLANKANYSINGVAGEYFDVENNGINQIILTPKETTVIKPGDVVSYNGVVEYKTAMSNPGGCGNPVDLYPTINFADYGTYIWGTRGPTLFRPENVEVDENRVLTFNGDENAGSYAVSIYNEQNFLVASQTVTQSGETLIYDVSGNYYLFVQSVSGDDTYLTSIVSDTAKWNYTNPEAAKYPSIFCGFALDGSIDHGNNDWAVFTWETIDGNLVISIDADVATGNSETYFRNNGFRDYGNYDDKVSKFSINGIEGDYFTLSSADESQIILTPKVTINPGDQITYNGVVEYRTALTDGTGLWPTINFGSYGSFTWGTTCAYSPEVRLSKGSVKFSPDTGVQTFTIEAEKLTSALTVTATPGLLVTLSTITPDENGIIKPIDIYVMWDGGASSGGSVNISGGGLAFPKSVRVLSEGFSEYCNKLFTNQGGSAPVYLTISENAEKLDFTVLPYYSGGMAVWDRIQNITSDGGQTISTNEGGGTPTITATFDAALNAGDVITFGQPVVWKAPKADGIMEANAFIDAPQTYTAGLNCALTNPVPANYADITLAEVIDEQRKDTSASLRITADRGTYGLKNVRIREVNGKLPITGFDMNGDNSVVCTLTGLSAQTEYNFEIIAFDTLGYPSAVETLSLTTRGVLVETDFEATITDGVYNGEAHEVTAEAKVAGAGGITVLYDESPEAQVNAGSYSIRIAVAQGSDYLADTFEMGTLTISKMDITASHLVFDTTAVTYNGVAKTVSVAAGTFIAGAGLSVIDTVFYNNSASTEVLNAGSYSVSVSIAEGANYNAAYRLHLGTFIINKAELTAAKLSYDILSANSVYNGSAHTVEVSLASPFTGAGTLSIKYNGDNISPIDAKTYTVSVSAAEGTNFTATGEDITLGSFVVAKADLTLEHISYIIPDSIIYNAQGHSIAVSLVAPYTKAGAFTLKYNDAAGNPVEVGNYTVTLDAAAGINFNDTTGMVLGTLRIVERPIGILTADDFIATITNAVYNGQAHTVSVEPVPLVAGGIGAITILYDESPEAPVNAGEYAITIEVAAGSEYAAETFEIGTLKVSKAELAIAHLLFEIPSDSIFYDENEHPIDEVTLASPYTGAGLFSIKYNGDAAIPVEVGTYAVTLDAAEGANFAAATDVELGEFTIYPRKIVRVEVAGKAKLEAYLVNDVLYVSSNVASVRLLNISGIQVLESKAPGKTVSLAALPRGLYFAVLRGVDGVSVCTVKIVK